MYCLSCGHNLADAQDACPACDLPFDRADPRTYAISPPTKGPRWWRTTKLVMHTATAGGYFAALYISVAALMVWFLVEWLRPASGN